MNGNSLADLAVLGIACEGPIEPAQIATVAKALAPELWQPTTSVVIAAIQRNLSDQFLRHTGNYKTDDHLTVATAGAARIRALLLCAPDDLAPFAVQAAEALQFCFLDATDEETATRVLARLQMKLTDRLAAFERNSARCPYGGRYTNFWMDMEQRRLQDIVHFLATATGDTDLMP